MANKISVLIDVSVDKGITALKNLRTSIADADGATGKLKAGAAGLGDMLKQNMATAAVAAGGALVAFGIKAVTAFKDTAIAAQDMASATGLSVEEASRWVAVGDDFGVTAEQMAAGLGKVTTTLDDEKWKKYGIATRDAAGNAKDANTIILETFDALNAESNASERARMAKELLGKGYATLAPLIGKTRDELEDYLGSVEDGQVITDKEAKKARDLALAQDSLQDAFNEVTLAVGGMVAGFAPAIEDAAEMTTQLSKLAEVAGKLGGGDGFFGSLGDQIGWFTTNIKESKRPNEVFQRDTEALTLGADKLAASIADATDAIDDAPSSLRTFSDAANEARIATKALDDAYAALTGELDADEAWINAQQAIDDFRAKVSESGLSLNDKRLALIDTKRELINYLTSLDGVPAEKQTEILALIDQGAFDEAERALAYLSRGRSVAISAVTGGQLPNVPKFDSGGVMPGPRGQHNLALVAGGETILPTHKPGMSGGFGGNITINTNADERRVVEIIKRYTQRGGNL